jgi:hypothetical protein
MALDEFATILKARAFVSKVNPTAIPVPMEPYLEDVQAVLRVETDMGPDEAGCSITLGGKRYICVNAHDREERRRFTICHEIAHIVLGLRSDHEAQPWWSAKRPLAERLCDVFGAELLLPVDLFQPVAEEAVVGLAGIERLASDFCASFTATGSRYAASVSTPCAFVLSEDGQIRYSSRSKALIDARAWIPPRREVPNTTLSHRVRNGDLQERCEVDADVWFDGWERGGTLLEEARHLPQWDQTVSFLWFENEELPGPAVAQRRPESRWSYEGRETSFRRDQEEDEFGLKELDGHLRFPGRRGRR